MSIVSLPDPLVAGAGPLARFLAHSPAAHAILDHAGKVLYLSPSFQRVFGYNIDDIPHIAAWWPLAYPDPAYRADRQSTWEALIAEQLPRGGEIHNFEGRVRCKDGSEAWVEAHAGFSAEEIFITLVDITERKCGIDQRKKAVAAAQVINIEEQANVLAAAVRQSPNSVIVTDAEARITFVNDAFTSITGFTAAEVIGQSAHMLGAETTPPATLASLQQALAAGVPWQGEFHNRRRSGRIGIDNCHIAPVRDKAGKVTYFVGVQEDITEKRRVSAELERHRHHLEDLVAQRTEELASAEFRLRTIIDSSPDGIMELDAEGNIVMINPEAERLLDYSSEVLSGLSMHATLHHHSEQGDPHPAGACPIHQGISSGQVVRVMNDVFWRADGDMLPVSYAMHPIMRQGVVTGAVVSFSDNTIRRQAEQAREEARRAAEHLAHVKSDFLANMSHEIRTPLNGVLGLAQIGYRENAGRGGAQEKFARILDSGKLLLRIINDILDFSKIEAGKLSIESIAFSPARIIDDAIAVVNESATAKGLMLAVAPDLNLPVAVMGDPARLLQILINFLSNAVKFTPQGVVTLSARMDGGMLVFVVSDTGIGMSHEQLERLFVPFEQADTSTTRKYGGTGLGLSISQRLAHLMGGEIKVSSRAAEGSTFELYLPHVPADAAASESVVMSRATPAGTLRLAGLKILAAEDNEINRYVMQEMLEGEGAVVCLVENGELAVAEVRKRPAEFDVVLVDVQMPVMDGREATRLIRVLAPDLPVIGQTAHAIAAEHEKCHAAGMVDTLTKPLELDELVAAILRHTGRTVPDKDEVPPAALSRHSNSSGVIDWERLQVQHAVRPAFLKKLFGIALESHAGTASQLREMAGAADHAGLVRVAHGIKGAAGHFCAGPLETLARRVELAAQNQAPEAGALANHLADLMEVFVAEIREHDE